MNKEIYDQSVACIGPMGIGKSMLLAQVGRQTSRYEVVNVDMLLSFAYSHYLGHYDNFEEFERGIRKIVLDTRVDPSLPNYNYRLARFQREADEYFGTIKRYLKKLDFGQLDTLVGSLAVLQEHRGEFSSEGYECLRTMIVSLMASQATAQMGKPVILDFGANFGTDLKATKQDKEVFEKLFGPGIDVDHFMQKFLSLYGTRIYFNPGESYQSNPLSNDKYGKQFVRAMQGSYASYATDEIDVSKLFYGFDQELFSRPRRVLDIDVEEAKSKYINFAEQDRLIGAIKGVINQPHTQPE